MSRSEAKNKEAERFDIIVVPSRHVGVRRYKFTGRGIHCAIALIFMTFVLVVGGLSSLIYYRHAYISTEKVRLEVADYVRERATLLKKVAELEGNVSRIERFASKIESAVDHQGSSHVGKGPVDEEDSLPSPQGEALSSISLGAGIWKSPFSKSLTAGLNLKVNGLTDRIDDVEEKMHSVFALQQDKLFFWASLPSIWPMRGWITSEFGERRGFRRHAGRLHEGLDIASPRGTPIMAPADGVITFSGYSHGYGKMITIDHGYGVSTLYGHCSLAYVKEGQRVKRGMIIAASGNTGSSSGPHLHYEVHVDGVPVNPMLYVMR